MTSGYAEDSENTEASEDMDGAHADPADEFEGELSPHPPPTATEDPDTVPASDPPQDPDDLPTSPGVG